MVCVHKISEDGRIGELIKMSYEIADNHFTIDEFFLPRGVYQVVCHSPHSLVTNTTGVVNIIVHTRFPIFGESVPMSPLTRLESLHRVIIEEGVVQNIKLDGVVIRTLNQKFRGSITMVDNYMEQKYLHVKLVRKFRLPCKASEIIISELTILNQ